MTRRTSTLPAGARRVRRAATRLASGTADHALSSLSNLAGAVYAARLLTIEEFGAFGLVFATYLVVVGISRAAVGDTRLLTPQSSTHEGKTDLSTYGAAAVYAGLLSGAAVGCTSLALPSDIRPAFLTLSLALPGLVLLDALRYQGFAARQPRKAVTVDAAWLLSFAVIAVLVGSREDSTSLAVAVWGGSGSVVGWTVAWKRGLLNARPSAARSWGQRHRHLAGPLVLDYLLLAGTQQGAVYIITGYLGLAATASYRGAQVALGPLNVLIMGIAVFCLPVMRSAWDKHPRRLIWISIAASATLASLTLVAGLGVSRIPETVGTAILGSTWGPSQSLVIPVSLVLAGQSISFGAVAALRVMGLAARAVMIRVVIVVITLSAVLWGALTGDIQTVVYAQASCVLAASFLWWGYYLARSGVRSESRVPASPRQRPDGAAPHNAVGHREL